MKDKKKGLFYQKYTIEKTLKHHVMEWLGTAGSLVGFTLVSMKIRAGFEIWFFANILWAWFSYKHRHWGLFFLSLCYLVINAYGFFSW